MSHIPMWLFAGLALIIVNSPQPGFGFTARRGAFDQEADMFERKPSNDLGWRDILSRSLPRLDSNEKISTSTDIGEEQELKSAKAVLGSGSCTVPERLRGVYEVSKTAPGSRQDRPQTLFIGHRVLRTVGFCAALMCENSTDTGGNVDDAGNEARKDAGNKAGNDGGNEAGNDGGDRFKRGVPAGERPGNATSMRPPVMDDYRVFWLEPGRTKHMVFEVPKTMRVPFGQTSLELAAGNLCVHLFWTSPNSMAFWHEDVSGLQRGCEPDSWTEEEVERRLAQLRGAAGPAARAKRSGPDGAAVAVYAYDKIAQPPQTAAFDKEDDKATADGNAAYV